MLKPTKNRVLVRFEAREEQTQSGIYLVGDTNHATRLAKVVAVGPAVREVFVDDLVAVDQNGGATLVTLDNGDHYMLLESDIAAVVERN